MVKRTIFLPERELRILYIEQNYTIQQLCNHFNVSRRTVLCALVEHNIPKRTRSETQLLDLSSRRKHNITSEMLHDLYIKQGLSGPKICKLYDISSATLVRLCNRFEIQIRTRREQQQIISADKNDARLHVFLTKANKTHNNKYDYSKVKYINSHSKICVVCPTHGDFTQVAYKHIQGCGCPTCARESIPNTNDFITRANAIHHDRYDYSHTNYVKCMEKLTIICRVHGEFKQTPSNHLSGCGCPTCTNNHQITTDEFIQKSVAVHGERYDYSHVVYKKCNNKITIICRIHGKFTQTPTNHLSGRGCSRCGKVHAPTTEEFIEQAIKVHGDKYNYSSVCYVRATSKILIYCPIHGQYKQTPSIHLRGGGCGKCVNNHSSKICIDWLEYVMRQEGIHIQHADNGGEYKFSSSNKKLKSDGYCAETNTIYEFYGDVFHGNPAKYQSFEPCHPFTKKLTAGYLFQKTVERELLIKSLGYNIITMWESDWNNFKKGEQI